MGVVSGCGLQIPDFLKLDGKLEKMKNVLVVGGGFLGTELAVGMATRCEIITGSFRLISSFLLITNKMFR